MRARKRGAALLLAAALCLPTAFAQELAPQSFVDVPAEHWAAADIAAAAESGLIQGTGGGRFEPEREVTYGEFLTMLVRLTCPEKVDSTVPGAVYALPLRRGGPAGPDGPGRGHEPAHPAG